MVILNFTTIIGGCFFLLFASASVCLLSCAKRKRQSDLNGKSIINTTIPQRHVWRCRLYIQMYVPTCSRLTSMIVCCCTLQSWRNHCSSSSSKSSGDDEIKTCIIATRRPTQCIVYWESRLMCNYSPFLLQSNVVLKCNVVEFIIYYIFIIINNNNNNNNGNNCGPI